jgi:pimeloyl-ACP methyl ester carboxylesterase
VVLSGTLINPDFPASAVEREVKLQTHQEWAAALPHADHILVPEARHYLQNETPAIVIDAIKSVIEKTRKASLPSVS